MRAIILAAGRGSRMGHRTADLPKCLTPLAERPLLHWQLDALRAAGIDQIAIVRGYRAEQLADTALVAFDNPRWAETNMVRSLLCADAWLKAAPCLVSYSDIVYHSDIVRVLMACEAPLAIAYDLLWRDLWTLRFADPLSDAETFRTAPNGNLLEIGKRAASLDEIEGQYMGLLKYTPEGWKLARSLLDRLPAAEQDKLDMTSLLGLLLARGIQIATVPVAGGWCEVDSSADADLYESRLQSQERWSHDWR
jgi:choline kinase